MEFNWLQAIGLFFASFALDAIFALYTVAVMKTKPLQAASWSLLTYLLYAVGLVSFIDNKWYLIPLSVGAFAGAYAVVKYEAIKKAGGTDKH
jgi:uncharacterized protein YebE (UPF0316 family)